MYQNTLEYTTYRRNNSKFSGEELNHLLITPNLKCDYILSAPHSEYPGYAGGLWLLNFTTHTTHGNTYRPIGNCWKSILGQKSKVEATCTLMYYVYPDATNFSHNNCHNIVELRPEHGTTVRQSVPMHATKSCSVHKRPLPPVSLHPCPW